MQTRGQLRLDVGNNAANASVHRTILTLAIWTPGPVLVLVVPAALVTRKVRFGGAGSFCVPTLPSRKSAVGAQLNLRPRILSRLRSTERAKPIK